MPRLLTRLTDRCREKTEKLSADPSLQIDIDANSTKKGGTYYFGYKNRIGVVPGGKLICKIAFITAAPHDSTILEELMSECERSLFGDKAYDRDSLKEMARQGPPDRWRMSTSGQTAASKQS